MKVSREKWGEAPHCPTGSQKSLQRWQRDARNTHAKALRQKTTSTLNYSFSETEQPSKTPRMPSLMQLHLQLMEKNTCLMKTPGLWDWDFNLKSWLLKGIPFSAFDLGESKRRQVKRLLLSSLNHLHRYFFKKWRITASNVELRSLWGEVLSHRGKKS